MALKAWQNTAFPPSSGLRIQPIVAAATGFCIRDKTHWTLAIHWFGLRYGWRSARAQPRRN